MTILTTKKTWTRPGTIKRRPPNLTAVEQENVRRAVRFLRANLGGAPGLAVRLGMTPLAVRVAACQRRGRQMSVAFALRVARFAKVPIDAILSGQWPSG